MRPIAFLSCAEGLAPASGPRPKRREYDVELAALVPACRDRGLELRPVAWDDPRLDPDGFAALVVGTTWDYTRRPAEFLGVLARLAARRPLLNPLGTVRWNAEKTYLGDLAGRGVAVVPTLTCDGSDDAAVAGAFDAFGADEVVVKPLVGAGADGQLRLRRGAPLPARPPRADARWMVQPYLPSIETEGELSFVFFDRALSHVVRKVPAAGDYRIQARHGGRESRHEPAAADLAAAHAVLDAVEGPLLLARVDLVRDAAGGLLLMELELIEPYLYPEQGPETGERFAQALVRLLDG